jgi:hypothetical protein
MSHIRVKLVRRATPRAQIASSGKLVSISQVTITSGIVISHCIDYAFAESQGISPNCSAQLATYGGADRGHRLGDRAASHPVASLVVYVESDAGPAKRL